MLERLDDGQRLLVLSALEQDPGQRRGGAGVARIGLEGPPQLLLVARLDRSGGRKLGVGWNQAVEEALDLGRRNRPRELVDDAPTGERLDGGDPLDAERLGQLLVLVHVDLRELDPPLACGRGALERRPEGAAGRAPLGPEVHDDGDLLRSRDHSLLEICLSDVECHAHSRIGARVRR